MSLKSIFKDHVSSSAFKRIDGELRVIGKFGQISMIDNVFDIWLVGESPLSERKLSALLKKTPQNVNFRRLDGEAYVQTTDLSIVLKLLPVCRIRRRKKLSEKEQKRLAKQFKRCLL